MLIDPEDIYQVIPLPGPGCHPESLHSFKHGLTVMQGQGGRAEGKVGKGKYHRLLPTVSNRVMPVIITDQHMVCHIFTEFEGVKVHIMHL